MAGIGCRAGESPDMSDARKSGALGKALDAAMQARRGARLARLG